MCPEKKITYEINNQDENSPDIKETAKFGYQIERKDIKTKFEAKNISAAENVKDCITSDKKFDVESFGTDPIISSLVREVTGKNNNEELTQQELQKIISLYPERVIKVHLAKAGQLDAFMGDVKNYKEILKKDWNSEKIAADFQKNGKNAMTIAGASYGLSVLFGLGGENSTWYKELTNASAYKESGKKPWKIALTSILGVQAGGIPLLETAGTGIRFGVNALGRVSYTVGALFDSLLTPSRWSEIVGGKTVSRRPNKEEILKLLPVINGYFTPEGQALFGKLYTEETGKNIELSETQIKQVAHLSVLLADSKIKDGEIDTLESDTWKRGQLQNLTDMSALALARHPDSATREQFQTAVNLEIEKQKAYRDNDPNTVSDWNPLFKIVDGAEKGEITKIINNKKFDKDFNEGAKQLMSKMTKKERKSILQMATSHGLSGLLVMAWVFLQGSFMAIQGAFSLGGKLLGGKDKKEKNDPVNKSAEKATKLLAIETKDLDKKDWTKLLSELVSVGAINKTVSSKLQKKKEKEYKKIFEELRVGNKNEFSISNTTEIKDIAKMQNSFKASLEKAGERIDKFVPLGELGKRKNSLEDLYYFKEGLQSFVNSEKDNYALSPNKFWGTFKNYLISNPKTFVKKRGSEISKRFGNMKLARVSTTGAAIKLLSSLGVPTSRLDKLKKTKKADQNRMNEIIKLTDDVLGTYNHDAGKNILDGLKQKK